jgi:hypothetical protein
LGTKQTLKVRLEGTAEHPAIPLTSRAFRKSVPS